MKNHSSSKLNVLDDDKLQKFIIIIMIVLLSVFIILPLLFLFSKAFTNMEGKFVGLGNFNEYFCNPSLLVALKNSLFTAITSSVIGVFLALIYAYGISRTNIKLKGFFKVIAILPLFVPSMLYSLSLVYLFGNKGVFTSIGINIGLYGSVGIIISEIIFIFPQAFLIIHSGLAMTDNSIYESAEVLGTSSLRKLLRITLPSIKYPLISSFFISFIMAFTDFGAPKVLGGNYTVLATEIYKQIIGQFNMSMGAAISLVMLTPVLIAFFTDRVLSKRQGITITSKSKSYKIKDNKARDTLFFTVSMVITFIILSMILTAVIGSFINLWPYDFTFTLKNYKFEGLMNSGWDTYFNSLKISTITAVLGTIFTFCNGYLIEKVSKYKVLRSIAYLLSMIPMALPGLVLGLSYIFFFNDLNNPLGFLYNTIWIIVFVNIIHFYSVSFITSTTSLKMLDSEYEILAKSMNIPFYKLFYKVTVPMCINSILEVSMYFFVNSMVTVSALIFLYTPETQTSAISILKLSENGDGGSAAAMAVLILLTNVAVRLIYETIVKIVSRYMKKRKNIGGIYYEW